MTPMLLSLFVVTLGSGPVQFTGTASTYGEYGWVSDTSLVQSRREWRFNINPSLSLWNFPIGMNILVSTQESPFRQQLDKFKMFLNPRKWLESQSELSGLALSFKSLELGSCNPSWTPYTLAGAPVFGGAVELNPWYVYAAAAAGRNQRRVDVTDSSQGAYARMLYSGSFGFGKKEGTHFYFTALYTMDDTMSPPRNVWQPNPNAPTDSYEVVKPQENRVFGAEFNLDLGAGAFRLESEVAGCELTTDRRYGVIESFSSLSLSEAFDDYLGWTIPILHPRMSSSFDFAYKVRPVLNVLDTRLYGKLEMVGPGFSSHGSPGLRGDNFAVGGGIERSFLDNAISASASYSGEHDNLLQVPVEDDSDRVVKVLTGKTATTRSTRWDANLGLAFPNLPYLQLGYYPYFQYTDDLDSLARVVSTKRTAGVTASASTGHSFQTGTLSHSPSVSFSYNNLRGPTEDNADNTSWDASLNYGLGFESPLSLSAGAGFSNSVSASSDPDQRLYFDVTPSYTFFEKWTNSLTIGGTFISATRVDLRYSSSFPIWKICDGSVGVSDAIYKGDDGGYNDLRLTAELSKSW